MTVETSARGWRLGPRSAVRDARETGRAREILTAYGFLLPALVIFVVFRFGPGIAGLALSFFDYQPGSPSVYRGTEHYRQLLHDPVFFTSLRVTAEYTVITVPLIVLAALGMAVLCNRAVRGIGVYRSLFFLPVVTSLVLSGVLWRWIYDYSGPLNTLLAHVLGVSPVPWIQSTSLVIPSLSFMSVWNRFGFGMLILLAGLQNIPGSLYEAATLDGSSRWQQFRDITLPLLRPALFLVIVLETIEAFQIFDAVYVMTGGGPVHGSYTLLYMLYDQAFTFFNYGYASTIGVVLFILTLIVAIVQRRVLRGWET